MLVTNSTSKKLRFSIMKDKSEDETFEALAYVIDALIKSMVKPTLTLLRK